MWHERVRFEFDLWSDLANEGLILELNIQGMPRRAPDPRAYGMCRPEDGPPPRHVAVHHWSSLLGAPGPGPLTACCGRSASQTKAHGTAPVVCAPACRARVRIVFLHARTAATPLSAPRPRCSPRGTRACHPHERPWERARALSRASERPPPPPPPPHFADATARSHRHRPHPSRTRAWRRGCARMVSGSAPRG